MTRPVSHFALRCHARVRGCKAINLQWAKSLIIIAVLLLTGTKESAAAQTPEYHHASELLWAGELKDAQSGFEAVLQEKPDYSSTLSVPSPASAPPAGKDQTTVDLTILFFTASWCEPCHAVQPILEKFTRKHPQEVRLVPVDYDRRPDEAARWDVRKIPVVILISKEGKVLLRADGAERETLRTLPSALEDALKEVHERR